MVELGRTQRGTGDNQTGVDLLAAAGGHALVDQPQQSVGHHAGVKAQVLVSGQRVEHRRAQRADSQLHRVAVVDELGDMGGDALLGDAWCAGGIFGQRPVGSDASPRTDRAESVGVPTVTGIRWLISAMSTGVCRSASAT